MQFSTLFAITFRVTIALFTRTYFQPDEYFQSLEVAHHLVFGYGHLTWEWLSPRPIRSIIYPALNVPIYWLLKYLQLDETEFLIVAPKLLHGLLAAITDVSVRKFTKNIIGEKYVDTVFFLSLTSFFHALSLSRSLSNSLETSLTILGLSFFPWSPKIPFDRRSIQIVFVVAALACAVRPTNAVIWVYILALLLWRLRSQRRNLIIVLCDIACIGTFTLSVLITMDSAYYRRFTVTPLNFLYTNLSPVSSFYGTSPWYYYLVQSPILCATALPFVAHGIILAVGSTGTAALKCMLGLLVWTLGIYSYAQHKEWRFLHPLLPLIHVFAAISLVYWQENSRNKITTKYNGIFDIPVRRPHIWIILLMVPVALYTMLVHSRAQIDVMYFLRGIPPEELSSIGFLMPCHSTPWQAYLHKPHLAEVGKLWAIGCEPPLLGQNISTYMDQTDVFYESPVAYLHNYFPSEVDPTYPPSPVPITKPGTSPTAADPWRHEWPQYVVMFGALLHEPGVRDLLQSRGYGEIWNAEFGWEGENKRGGGVRVWKHTIDRTDAPSVYVE